MMRFFYDLHGEVCAFSDADLQVLGARIAEYKELTPEQEALHLNPLEPSATAEQLKAIVTAFRWEVETGGITLPTGMRVATDKDDRPRTKALAADTESAGLAGADFKALSGWAWLTIAELQDVSKALIRHEQACFSAERAHHEAIDALLAQHQNDPEALQAALDGYDESQGWPSVDLSQAED